MLIDPWLHADCGRTAQAWSDVRAQDSAKKRGKEISDAVQAESQELRAQGVDADRYFTKKCEEYAEALGSALNGSGPRYEKETKARRSYVHDSQIAE